ncbi:DUF5330 domain-containing protein [Nitratireductor mangrovi]|uniref:DUF5330 domain-containing protein n=1 Tax=Nitratireductor mangrovi TaxID=2599600 RepID=A0A5B8KZS9_9HYPH|nr:DUF5330 domain-containing protein [Nitratireductor mangrovi]QDZ01096.1 DUF5330 domain-containing protein [Nitratireductor mangrovi]
MGFLLRSAFWLSLVLLFLPISPQGDEAVDTVSPLEAIVAARGAFTDVSGMCSRRPDVCETGRAAFQTIGVRAKESARIAYELLDDNLGDPDRAITTGGVSSSN